MPAAENSQTQPQTRLLQTLGLCKRAGKLILGIDSVKEAAGRGTACLLAVSAGVSDNTMKEMKFIGEQYDIPLVVIDASLDDLWYILGKRVGVMCVTDQALGSKIAAGNQTQNGRKDYDTKKI